MPTYSFVDVQVSIAGPGGAFSLAPSGAGVASEGITVEMAEDKDNMVVGADGVVMHSLHAGNAGTITVRLLQTSPVNQQMKALYDYQRLSAANWGQNVITINNPASGDVTVGRDAAFRRAPTITYATDGTTNEWAFNVGNIDTHLGDYGAPAT